MERNKLQEENLKRLLRINKFLNESDEHELPDEYTDFDEFEFHTSAKDAAKADIEKEQGEGSFEEIGQSKYEKDKTEKEFGSEVQRAKLDLPSDKAELEKIKKSMEDKEKHEKQFGKGSLNEITERLWHMHDFIEENEKKPEDIVDIIKGIQKDVRDKGKNSIYNDKLFLVSDGNVLFKKSFLTNYDLEKYIYRIIFRSLGEERNYVADIKNLPNGKRETYWGLLPKNYGEDLDSSSLPDDLVVMNFDFNFDKFEEDHNLNSVIPEMDALIKEFEEKSGKEVIEEAEYQGKTVKLNKPMRGDVKKFKVYVKNDKGNVVKVNFGDKNMEIKRDDPERRKSFRARHNCSNPGPKWKARYWSCKMWGKKSVSDILNESSILGTFGDEALKIIKRALGNPKKKEIINEGLEIKKLDEVGTDIASFLIIDPAAIKEENFDENGHFVDKQERGFEISTGADGDYEIVGIYDDSLEHPHVPIAIMLKIREESENLKLNEGVWGHEPMDSDTSQDWLFTIGELIIKNIKEKINKYLRKDSGDDSWAYKTIGMWEFFKNRLYDSSAFRGSDIYLMDMLTKNVAEVLVGNDEWTGSWSNPEAVQNYLNNYINKIEEEHEHTDERDKELYNKEIDKLDESLEALENAKLLFEVEKKDKSNL